MTPPSFGCRGSADKIGVLVAQLGTPDAPDAPSLRRYLRQFLSDPRVIEKNRLLWWLILHGIVLRTRPKRSARLYRRIWTDEGSPLLLISRKQTELLARELQKIDADIVVRLGMRYGSPSIESALDDLVEAGCSRILLFPMYPQYSATTTASTYDVVFQHLSKRRWVPTLRVAEPYFVDPRYISAQARIINEAYSKLSFSPERLVLSYHGIPAAYVEKGDPYCCMCSETTGALLPQLEMPADSVIHTYQSRFGRDPWLEPYTDVTIESLAKSGIKRIAVVCPGFTADCLETLDELGNEARELFTHNGGEQFHLIPCLNDHPEWISAMAGIVRSELGSWLEGSRRCQISCPMKRGSSLGERAA